MSQHTLSNYWTDGFVCCSLHTASVYKTTKWYYFGQDMEDCFPHKATLFIVIVLPGISDPLVLLRADSPLKHHDRGDRKDKLKKLSKVVDR